MHLALALTALAVATGTLIFVTVTARKAARIYAKSEAGWQAALAFSRTSAGNPPCPKCLFPAHDGTTCADNAAFLRSAYRNG